MKENNYCLTNQFELLNSLVDSLGRLIKKIMN
jgi:hypothetical protein